MNIGPFPAFMAPLIMITPSSCHFSPHNIDLKHTASNCFTCSSVIFNCWGACHEPFRNLPEDLLRLSRHDTGRQWHLWILSRPRERQPSLPQQLF